MKKLFTIKKILAYVCFAFAIAAFVMNIVVSTHKDGQYTYVQKQEYVVIATGDTVPTVDETYGTVQQATSITGYSIYYKTTRQFFKSEVFGSYSVVEVENNNRQIKALEELLTKAESDANIATVKNAIATRKTAGERMEELMEIAKSDRNNASWQKFLNGLVTVLGLTILGTIFVTRKEA